MKTILAASLLSLAAVNGPLLAQTESSTENPPRPRAGAAEAATAAGGEEARVVIPDEPIDFDGLVLASRVIKISAATDGILETVTVERGDRVEKDQVLATLDSRVELAALEVIKARVELEGSIRKERARLAYSDARMKNDEELRDQGLLSSSEFDQTRTERELAASRLTEALENKRLSELELKRGELALAQRTIRAPFSGVVTERFLSPGELVARQLQSKIVEIAQISPLRVEVVVPAEFFGTISAGANAVVTIKTGKREVVRASVLSIDRVIDASSDTFRVRLELPNPGERLAPGLKCKVRFE